MSKTPLALEPTQTLIEQERGQGTICKKMGLVLLSAAIVSVRPQAQVHTQEMWTQSSFKKLHSMASLPDPEIPRHRPHLALANILHLILERTVLTTALAVQQGGVALKGNHPNRLAQVPTLYPPRLAKKVPNSAWEALALQTMWPITQDLEHTGLRMWSQCLGWCHPGGMALAPPFAKNLLDPCLLALALTGKIHP